MKTQPTTRNAARRMIIDAANAHRLRRHPAATPLNRRQLQLAVCICRQNLLAGAAVLTAAGFNPERSR